MSSIKYVFLLLFILTVISCSGTKNLSEVDLNSIESSVESIDSTPSHYLLTLYGFTNIEEESYQVSINRLNKYSEDVLEIAETSSSTGSPSISAKLNDDPKSLNRVLWVLGEGHYRNHRIELEKPDSSTLSFENLPEIIGGLSTIQQDLNYPPELKTANIQGRVIVSFIVNDFGEVEDPEIIESLHMSADAEAIRVVRNTKFRPGMMNGVPISVDFSMPINFRQ